MFQVLRRLPSLTRGLPGLRSLASFCTASEAVPARKGLLCSPWIAQQPVVSDSRTFSSLYSSCAPIGAVVNSRLLDPSFANPQLATVRGLKPHPNKPFGERIVRRRKMRVHKLRKWRKKFMADIMRAKRKRELVKEKALMAELNAFIAEGEKYNPREEVREFLERLNQFYYPKYWKGVAFIPWYIKKCVDEDLARKKKKEEADLRAHAEALMDQWEKEGRLKY